MRYNLVEIFPDGDRWRVRHSQIDGDREAANTKPNPIGCYYYPEDIPSNIAQQELVNAMILAHDKHIADLTNSRKALELLK